jgi:hypothetical protein
MTDVWKATDDFTAIIDQLKMKIAQCLPRAGTLSHVKGLGSF